MKQIQRQGSRWLLVALVLTAALAGGIRTVPANLGDTTGCKGAWIRARVSDAGTYVLTNSRNGHSKTYRVR